MFYDFSDKDFSLVMLSRDTFNELSCRDLVNTLKERGVNPCIVSKLVNVQRTKYNLDEVTHSDYKSILLDTVVSGRDYFFKCEGLRIILSCMVTTSKEGVVDIDSIAKISKEVVRLVSFKTNHKYGIGEYIEAIS